MKKTTRILAIAVVVALGGNTPATAHPSHTSCKTFGTGTGDVARGGTPPWASPGTAELVASLHEGRVRVGSIRASLADAQASALTKARPGQILDRAAHRRSSQGDRAPR